MKTKHFIIGLALYAVNMNLAAHAAGYRYEKLYEGLDFDMPRVEQPVFPGLTVSITQYGGIGNGQVLNTQAFEQAMQDLERKGGGTLNVPAGVWLTGPIVFRSNINLHLENNALLLLTADKDAYPLVETSFEGLNTRRAQSPISGKNLTNIAITGKGAINGNGDSWRPVKKGKVTEEHWKKLIASGGVLKNPTYWFPSESALLGETLSPRNENIPGQDLPDSVWHAIRDFMRPVMVNFTACKNVLLQGVLFENSPSWNLHPLMCENLIIDGVTVRNPAYAQNGDGLDVESCKNVIIVNSSFDVGDDAICLKSGKDEDGRRRAIPTENVLVSNCRVFKGHGGFVVGSEMSGGVRNVSVRDCQFIGTDVGLRFKSTRGRGGIVENIYIDRIYMLDIVMESFLFDLYYGQKGQKNTDSIPPVTEGTPAFKNIHVSNMVSHNSGKAMFFNGLPEMNICNIHVSNVTISSRQGAEISESAGVFLDNISLWPENGPVLLLNNVKNVEITNLTSSPEIQPEILVTGTRNADIKLPDNIAVR